MTKETLKPDKYFNSGLYKNRSCDGSSFYKKHRNKSIQKPSAMVAYNRCLFSKVWKEDEETEDKLYDELYWDEDDEDRLYNRVIDDLFWEKLSLYSTYFELQTFDEEIALQCGLIPFVYRTHKGNTMELLALGGGRMHLFPKLEAYQVFAHGTIDPRNSFFTNKNYFEEVVGKGIVNEMKLILKSSN